MKLRAIVCPQCGGPLPDHARWRPVTCPFCGASVTLAEDLVSASEFREALARAASRDDDGDEPSMELAGHRFRLFRHIADGASGPVFLARRVGLARERVMVHVARDGDAFSAMGRAWSTLEHLEKSRANGTPHFAMRLPQRVVAGTATIEGQSRKVHVVRYLSGYTHTLADVRRALPGGVDARHVVWMWRRALELLGWVHQSEHSHGQVSLEHLIVHPQDHGIRLAGWSRSRQRDEGADPMLDTVDLARCMIELAGGDGHARTLPTHVPPPIADVLIDFSTHGGRGAVHAWEQLSAVGDAAKLAFGPPQFVPFVIP